MTYSNPEVRRARDRERYHKRVALRREHGLCPTCGKVPPEPGRSRCGPCAEKHRVAGRARDARLRAAGIQRRDPIRAKAGERDRARRRTAERAAQGLCTKCGRNPPEPDRRTCEPCAVKRRKAERERYDRARSAGKKYGGRPVQRKRRSARIAGSKQWKARREANLCTRCGRRPPAGGRTTCEPCLIARRKADQELYAARRAAGVCVKCGDPANGGGTTCAPCSAFKSKRDVEAKNAAARRRYAERRSRSQCTDCGSASHGAARCESCARRSYERSHHVRGMPMYPPVFSVIEIGTGVCHGVFDSEADVSLCLAFAKLSRDEVEVIVDEPVLARSAGWE